MREVVLRPEAEADIDAVADYTIEQWGREQARRYVDSIRRTTEALPRTGTRYPVLGGIYPELRRARCRHHHIYYIMTPRIVDVVRIMHERRNATYHFG